MPKLRCPKCQTEMARTSMIGAIPEHVAHDARDKDGYKISPKEALPVFIYHCPQCRFVELYSEEK
jgi:predicted nucleic-acid-binding Zn-ribbon protein